jgi:putative peptidoglycan lipid II flippase
MPSSQSPEEMPRGSVVSRALQTLHPSHAHTAFTATILLAAAAFLSKIISLVRVQYITHVLGSSPMADAFNASFQLPDTISYFLLGGATSITFVTMLTRYRESNREAEGEEAFSVIFTTMMVVLSVAIVAAEFLAPVYVRYAFPGFLQDPAKFAKCVQLTRVILPGQAFFFGGGIFAAVLLARKQFTLQAFAPLIYNVGMILGGVTLFWWLGVDSIAWGGLAGVILGPFAINAWGARRAGMRLRLHLDFKNKGLREWVGLSLPLMLGFSLTTVDSWIISHYASQLPGDVSLLSYAKQLFSVPQALGQAAGAASLPFLASLFGREGNQPFAKSVNDSVSRIVAFSFLLTAWMVPMGGPAVDFFFRGGRFGRADTGSMALYFAIFALSLCFWSAQAIYARAFYATSNTLTPMIAATVIVLAMLPVYALLFHAHGAAGLAFASDIGIALQACVFAWMLHRRGLAPVRGLDWAELGRSLLAAAVSAGVLFGLRLLLPARLSRLEEFGTLLVSALLWIGLCWMVLRASGSSLPEQLARRIAKR